MKKIITLLSITFAIFILAACGNDDTATETVKDDATNAQLSIYTTVYPLQYFAQQIGGEFVNVQSIYPAGANEHSFEPTQKDMMNLADADYFFYIGLGLEGFVENAKKTLANEDVQLIATADELTEQQLHTSTGHVHAEDEHDHEHHEEDGHDHEAEEAHEDHDAHVWLSPTLSKDLALKIKNELVAALPENEQLFNDNYDALVNELTALNNEFTVMADEAATKTFFVSHAAFGYIAGNYGLTQIPVAGLNSQSEPSQKELTKIVDRAKEENIKTIFFEQNVSSNLTEVIQNEIGAESLILHNLSVLTEDDIKNNEDYFSLMRKNIDALKQALN